jgi:hypothetical protein
MWAEGRTTQDTAKVRAGAAREGYGFAEHIEAQLEGTR